MAEKLEKRVVELEIALNVIAGALFLHRYKGPQENPDELEAKVEKALESVGIKP